MEEKTKSKPADVYSIVTDHIIAMLEKGTVPWKQSWTNSGLPQNLVSKRAYRGINVWLLSMLGYEQNYFLTSKQLKENFDGVPKKGEKGIPVIFWNWKEVPDEDSGEVKQVPFLRYYSVFNVNQVEGIPATSIPIMEERNNNPIKACEDLIAAMPNRPMLHFKEQKAYYNPLLDFINLPKMKTFESSEHFYETYFHELIHSTGHCMRLNRKELMAMAEFWGDNYSIEELIAEMGACYLKSICGFTQSLEQNVSYLQGWLEKLKNDKHFVIYAAARAQSAVDYILNVERELQHQEDAQ